MSHERRRKVKDVVLKIGDKNKTIRGVTDHTTCGDVIKMMLRKIDHNKQNEYSYAIFECGNESERMLSDKTKVLKTMRSWGSGNSKHFSMKAAHQANKIFKAKQEKTKTGDKLLNNLDKTRNIENATKLAHLVQSQKTRLQRQRSNNHMTEIYRDDGDTSISEFISNVDQTKMAGFLDFCGTVSANELDRLSGITNNSKANKHADDNGFVSGTVISRVDKINDVKYATKKVLKPKRISVTHGHTNARMARKHTFFDCEPRNIHVNSTQARRGANRNLKRHEALAESITSKIARVEQRDGKDVILQKYFSDYLSYNSPNGRGKPFPMPKRERGDGAELNFSSGNPDKGDGSFSSGTSVHSNTARVRRHSDSDSGQEDHDHHDILDDAFVCKTVTGYVDSNHRYDHIKTLPRKFVKYDATMVPQSDKLVDYSFSDSSVLESGEDTIEIFERNVFDEDDEMASFMDSKLHDDFSDEGLSSLDSEDEREILV